VNPVQDARIPRNAREPGETFAYSLNQIFRILESLPLLPKAAVATAAYAGLREGELKGLEWADYEEHALQVNRSVWKTHVNKPKTRASANPVPVIRHLAEILDAYRMSVGNPIAGVMFHTGGGERMDFDKLAQLTIRPVIEMIGLEWYGWHGFRRGIASNLYELGADEKIVQRVLRHAKAHVTKDRYIKAFDPAVLAAMKKMETTLDNFHKCSASVQQVN
jgi:integrase